MNGSYVRSHSTQQGILMFEDDNGGGDNNNYNYIYLGLFKDGIM
jgi:hypothetical protein